MKIFLTRRAYENEKNRIRIEKEDEMYQQRRLADFERDIWRLQEEVSALRIEIMALKGEDINAQTIAPSPEVHIRPY